MIVVVVKQVGRNGRFSASVDGKLLVKSSRMPFLDAARVLLKSGTDPNERLVMRHDGKDTDCLCASVGIAAQLMVVERDRAKPTFAPWRPFARPPSDQGDDLDPEGSPT